MNMTCYFHTAGNVHFMRFSLGDPSDMPLLIVFYQKVKFFEYIDRVNEGVFLTMEERIY